MPPSLSTLDKNSKVWYRKDSKTWLLAEIIHATDPLTLQLLDDGSALDNVPLKQVEPANPAVQDGISDVTQLSYLNEPGILHNLLQRYHQDVIYTKAGPVLVAVNPCKGLALYTVDVAEQYKAGCLSSSAPLDPHIYSVTGTAFRDMIRLERSQSIVINGESGAGKTETAKKAMQFLTALAGGTGVDQHVLETNPILEAFGNAKTQRNPNSSRFGKLIEICFNNQNQICGARIKTYLLEKSRVVHQLPDERSFHIFYQLMKGVTDPAMRQELRLPDDVAAFKYLSKSGCTDIPGVDDASNFAEVLKGLSNIGMDYNTGIKPLLATLSGILWLGNLRIEGNAADDSSKVVADDALSSAAVLIGVKEGQLAHAITHKKITAGAETIIKTLTPAEATDARDALAKSLYAGIFDQLVAAINSRLDIGRMASGRFIAILDIYGFEHFKTNSFEQLCINYANERLQQQFTHHLFTQEQELYEEEGIDWSKINWVDNQASLDIIETNPRTGPGLLAVLNTLCKIASSTDEKFMTELRNNLYDNEPQFSVKPHRPNEFVIKHYAADVAYDVAGFLDKNRDTLNQDLIELMSSSSSSVVSSIGAALAAPPTSVPSPNTRPGQPPRPTSQTVSSKFTAQLQDLVSMLDTTGLHFVRCIKPNPTLEPGTFAAEMVLQQLRCCGVLEVARVAQAGFPTRYKYPEFVERYRVLLPADQQGLVTDEADMDARGLRDAVKELLKGFGVEAGEYELGRNTVFFKTGVLGHVEDRWTQLQSAATRIQSTWRMYVARKDYLSLRQAAIAVQGSWKARAWRKEMNRQHKAAVVLQRGYKSYKARQKILHAIHLVREANRAGKLDNDLSQRIASQVATAGAIDELMLQYGLSDMAEVTTALECYCTLKKQPGEAAAAGTKGPSGVRDALQLLAVLQAATDGRTLTPDQLEQSLKIAAFCQQHIGPNVTEQQLQEMIDAAADAEDAKQYAATVVQQALQRRQPSVRHSNAAMGSSDSVRGSTVYARDADVAPAASKKVDQQRSDVSDVPSYAQSDQSDKKSRGRGLFFRAKGKVEKLTSTKGPKPLPPGGSSSSTIAQRMRSGDPAAAQQAISLGTAAAEQGIISPDALKAALASNSQLKKEVGVLQQQLDDERAARMRFAKQQEQLALEWTSQVKILENYIRSLQAELGSLQAEVAAK